MTRYIIPALALLAACIPEAETKTVFVTVEVPVEDTGLTTPVVTNPADLDEDGDGWTLGDGDCDDSRPTTYPGAAEEEGQIICMNDDDDDGWGDDGSRTPLPPGVTPGTDCDDGYPYTNPGDPEWCDVNLVYNEDNDCDGLDDFADLDCLPPDQDGDGWAVYDGDCDDLNSEVHPEAQEVCDGIADNNCDLVSDLNELDSDGDSLSTCNGDCDDANDAIYPGATEFCNFVDDDCDGFNEYDQESLWGSLIGFEDYDGDGYSDYPSMDIDYVSCVDGRANLVGTPFVALTGDCHGLDPNTYPGAPEICDGQTNNNCEALAADPNELDLDLDGLTPCDGDLDDSDPAICQYGLNLGDFQNETYCDGLSLAAAATPDSLMQSEIGGTQFIYYMDESLNRHFVPNAATLESWWGAESCVVCDQVTLLDQLDVPQYALAANLTIRPGAFIIGIASDPQRFVIDACAEIRAADDLTLEAIYGPDWTTFVRIVPDIFFTDYTVGPDVVVATDYDLIAAQNRTLQDELACP